MDVVKEVTRLLLESLFPLFPDGGGEGRRPRRGWTKAFFVTPGRGWNLHKKQKLFELIACGSDFSLLKLALPACLYSLSRRPDSPRSAPPSCSPSALQSMFFPPLHRPGFSLQFYCYLPLSFIHGSRYLPLMTTLHVCIASYTARVLGAARL